MTEIYKVHVTAYSYLDSDNIVNQYWKSQNFVLIANREDTDQTASEKQSDLGLHCLSMFFGRQLVLSRSALVPLSISMSTVPINKCDY